MVSVERVVEWEQVVCDFCQSADSRKELDGVDLGSGLTERMTVVRCNRCGLLYLNPRPTLSSIPLIYPAAYGFHQSPRHGFLGRLSRSRALFRALLAAPHLRWFCALVGKCGLASSVERWSRRYPYLDGVRPGSILDVGCATGTTVYPFADGSLWQLKVRGWDVHGCEVSAPAAEIGRALGIDIRVGCIAGLDYGDQRFDVIRFNHVLEHSISPTKDLSAAARLLRNGGRLIVSGPNIESAAYALFGLYWSGLDLPRHFYQFTPASLRKYCEKTALRVDREYFDGVAEDFAHSLENFLQSDGAGNRNLTSAQGASLAAVLNSTRRSHFFQATKTLATHFNILCSGDNYTVIARPN